MFKSVSLRKALIAIATATLLAVSCDKAPEYEREGPKMEFVRIPAGEFNMGSPVGESGRRDNEGPQHRVKISEPFYMLTTEVTQQQYIQIMGQNPSFFKGADNPVEMVSWNDAMEFCRKLSEKTGKEITLPTEAQWEYACRAGTNTRFCFGDEEELLKSYCWYGENSGTKTHPVTTKQPNAWGLFDMHGNVKEWCSDRYDYHYYSNSPIVDPKGPSNGAAELRVIRGGAHPYVADFCRSATREVSTPDNLGGVLGFRIVFPAKDQNGEDIISIALATEAEKVVVPQEQTSKPQLADGLIITGMVRDEENMPIDDVEIGILRAENWDLRLHGEGKFEVSWEPYKSRGPQIRYYLLVRHTKRNLVAFLEINQDTKTLDVKLQPGAILTGKIVNNDGKGIKGAHITPIFHNWRATLPSLMMRTDVEGRFEVRALPWNQKYSLLLRYQGYGREEVDVQTDNASDNRVDIGQKVLGTANLTVSGIVVDPNDKPVGLALVYCTGKGQEGASGLTGPDGKFTLDGICKGKVKILASVGGSNRTNMSGSIETEAGATNVKVVMKKSSVPLPKGRTCFTAETEVWEDGTLVPVSEVGQGRDVSAVPSGYVERVEEHEGAFECRDVLLDSGNRISVVDSHCFMLDYGRWIAAQDLRAGQRLQTVTGTVGIKSVTIRPTPYVGKVYNLKINSSDRYAIGKDGVIVRDY